MSRNNQDNIYNIIGDRSRNVAMNFYINAYTRTMEQIDVLNGRIDEYLRNIETLSGVDELRRETNNISNNTDSRRRTNGRTRTAQNPRQRSNSLGQSTLNAVDANNITQPNQWPSFTTSSRNASRGNNDEPTTNMSGLFSERLSRRRK